LRKAGEVGLEAGMPGKRKHQGRANAMRKYPPRVLVLCAWCSKEKLQIPSDVVEKNYCDRHCRDADRRSKPADFWSNVDIRGPGECWPWLGAKHKRSGHGRYRWNGQERTAHSIAHELTYGETEGKRGTQGVLMRHSCDNPPCVNPAHIIPGTAYQNTKDMMDRGRHKPILGEASIWAKLTEQDVRDIRVDERSHAEVARQYGVSAPTISYLRKGKTWKHVK
jgi:hypothetical protein